MRKALLTIVLCIFYLSSFSQSEIFKGIGIFKIGSDSSALYDYAKDNKLKIKDADYIQYRRLEYYTKPTVFKLVKNKKDGAGSYDLDQCPETTEYFLTVYSVSDITIKRVRLVFFRNRLVKFSCNYSQDIIDALNTKYGKEPTKVTTDTVNCVYNLTGITRPLEAKTYSDSRNYGNIQIIALFWEHYDDHCQKGYNSLFSYSIDEPDWTKCKSGSATNNSRPEAGKEKLKDF